jgi:branched-chain amino acid transport system substrate-binding protein
MSVVFLLLCLLTVLLTGGCKSEPSEENPIILGVPTSLGYWFGQGALNGATMAMEEINAAGGVNVNGEMRLIKLVSIDTRDSVPGVPTQDALMAIEKLILDENIVGIVAAPNRSEVMVAAMDLNAKYKMPQISCLAKTPAVNSKVLEEYDKYKYCFRSTLDAFAIANYNTMAFKAVGEKFGFNKIAFINQDVSWANGVAALCGAALGESGWEVVASEAIPAGTTDFAVALSKAKEAGAQVLGLLFDMPEVSNLLHQYADMEFPGIAGGVIGPLSDPGSWDAYNGKIEGVFTHVCEAGVFPVPAIPKSVEFFNNYTERWGHEPEGVAGMSPSYDAVYIFKDAIERAGTTDPDALVIAIEQTDIQGAVGRIRFNDGHNVVYGTDPSVEALGMMIQWQAPGVRKIVIPSNIAEADFVLPPWMR